MVRISNPKTILEYNFLFWKFLMAYTGWLVNNTFNLT